MSRIQNKPQSGPAHDMLRCWMRQESMQLRIVIYVIAFNFFLFRILTPYAGQSLTAPDIIVPAAVLCLLILLLPRLLATKFAVKHSAVGRQLESFGDFNAVYADVCGAVQTPLYTNGTELISEKYIFLMPEPVNAAQTRMFSSAGRLLIIPTALLERVSVKPNTLYSDEMNTLIFRTARPLANASANGSLFTMTVHMDAAAAQKLADTITENICAQGAAGGQASPSASNSAETSARTFGSRENSREASYPFPSKRSPAARSAARFRSDPLRELLAGKLRVFRFIVFFIVLANVGTPLILYFITDNHTLSTLPQDFLQFIRIMRSDLAADVKNLALFLGLLAFYIIPLTAIYIMIRRWYRRFLTEYEKLPRQEQETLLSKLCDNFETGQPELICTEHCFCFRNIRMLKFQTLLPYSSVLWIYRSRIPLIFANAKTGSAAQAELEQLVIRTADRRKYRMSLSAEQALHRRVPDAVTGYGDIQKETYLDMVRSLKNGG